RLLLRLRRLSSNKIYVSNGEFKHTNNKIIVILYLFNRQKQNYILKLKKKYALINYKGLLSLKKINNNNNYNNIIKILNRTNNLKNVQNLYEYITKYYIKLSKKSLKKIKMYLYYKQLLYINKSKYNYTYLQYLKKYLVNIFNKNVEFNLVNLKRFYLNSDILTESIALKLRRNRRKILKYLKNFAKKVKTQNKFSFFYKSNLDNKKPNLKLNLTNKKKFILFKNLKYKHVTGFRLEASGRLTRRYTA